MIIINVRALSTHPGTGTFHFPHLTIYSANPVPIFPSNDQYSGWFMNWWMATARSDIWIRVRCQLRPLNTEKHNNRRGIGIKCRLLFCVRWLRQIHFRLHTCADYTVHVTRHTNLLAATLNPCALIPTPTQAKHRIHLVYHILLVVVCNRATLAWRNVISTRCVLMLCVFCFVTSSYSYLDWIVRILVNGGWWIFDVSQSTLVSRWIP